MNYRDKQEKYQNEEYKKNPMINFADSLNRSFIGDLGAMTGLGKRFRIIMIIIAVAVLIYLFIRG